MKLFRHSSGMIISFGFDMLQRKPDPHGIWWNDPSSGEWEPKLTNQAGHLFFYAGTFVAPEFVREHDNRVSAYQPGQCIEMTYVGGSPAPSPLIWNFQILRPDEMPYHPFDPWAKYQRIEWPTSQSLV